MNSYCVNGFPRIHPELPSSYKLLGTESMLLPYAESDLRAIYASTADSSRQWNSRVLVVLLHITCHLRPCRGTLGLSRTQLKAPGLNQEGKSMANSIFQNKLSRWQCFFYFLLLQVTRTNSRWMLRHDL